MQEGQKITFTGDGDQAPGIEPGDVIIVIEEKPHPRFKRKGADLYYQASIELLTALAGGQLIIEHLNERSLIVNILPGEVIKPGDTKAITGEGMPIHKRPFDKGTLFVTFDIVFPPPNWTEASKLKLLEEVLPARAPLPVIHGDSEEVVLSTMDPLHEQRRSQADAMDEDDEHQQGGPSVQCAQQ